MTNSCELVGAAFKDSAPLKTVEKIKGILAENGIKTTEVWHDSKVPYCYSLTVPVEGIAFSTNGKGLSPEFALASAYGELMERFQLGFIGQMSTQKDGTFSMNDSQDITIPTSQLMERDMDLYQKIADRLYEWNGTKITAKEILMQYVDDSQTVKVTPFFNLTNGQVAYIPAQMRKAAYTSNGCAAGNTMEEAIVQGLSEIVERYYRMQIIKYNICVPDVPEDVLKQYPTAYEIIESVRNQGYKVSVKDCSLGQKFPVVCVCYINEKTGYYHTHFGAYPDFEIALVRAITETFQGRNVDSFAFFKDFLYNTDEKSFVHNLSTELTYGCAKRMPDFFIGTNKLEYNAAVGFAGKNNKELLKECVEFFAEQGYPILVRDASCLGFPTCQIIIPGYSETAIYRVLTKTNPNRYLLHSINALRNPKSATMQDMLGCLMHIQETNAYSARRRARMSSGATLMTYLNEDEEAFLMSASMAYIYYTLGQISTAATYVQKMLDNRSNTSQEFLLCIKRYLDLKIAGYSADQVRAFLETFHSARTVARLYAYIDKKENPLTEFVLHCDLTSCDSCIIKEKCCQKKAQQYVDLINRKTGDLVFEESVALLKSLI